MEGLAVLSFLLIPASGGFMAALPIFGIALMLNSILSRYSFASGIVHVIAIVCLGAYYIDAIKGELGRSSAFMMAFIIGAFVCYIFYLILLKKINKAFNENHDSATRCECCGKKILINYGDARHFYCAECASDQRNT